MTQNTHYHSKSMEWGHNEDILDQSKNETKQDKLQIMLFYVWCQRVQMTLQFHLCWLQHTSLPWTSSSLYLQLSWVDIFCLWHLLHLGVLNPITALLSNLHSSGLCSATPLVSVAFHNCRGRHHNTFTPVSFITLQLEPHGQCCKTGLSTWDSTWPLPELYLHEISFAA